MATTPRTPDAWRHTDSEAQPTQGLSVSEPKEVTRAELEGRLWELLNNHDNSTQVRLESARPLHESIKARERGE